MESQKVLRLIVFRLATILSAAPSQEKSLLVNNLVRYLLQGLHTHKWHHSWRERGAGLKRVNEALSEILKTQNSNPLSFIVAQLVQQGWSMRQFLEPHRQPERTEINTVASKSSISQRKKMLGS